MNIKCDICNQGNKFHYVTREVDMEDGKKKSITACDECWSGPRPDKSNEAKFNDLQVPFWKILGLQPKPEEVRLERYLKNRGMTYGDWRRERDYKQATHASAYPQFASHIKKYGRNNAPTPSFNKGS